MFQDVWNPTQEEIKKWAYSEADIPEQDWELTISSFENIPMICASIEIKTVITLPFFCQTAEKNKARKKTNNL
ncbi:hypothetical protein [Oceanobacillus senegalensis]|uniref:hypothetical protein n=1 Tax=Oceanobacillus senegalensis TaxID=1936063 RepID=UPI000A3107A8|nr:hypothetical protein [Oceanobacillus senegalensis]